MRKLTIKRLFFLFILSQSRIRSQVKYVFSKWRELNSALVVGKEFFTVQKRSPEYKETIY